MKVIVTADHAGMTIRNEVKNLLEEKGIEYVVIFKRIYL